MRSEDDGCASDGFRGDRDCVRYDVHCGDHCGVRCPDLVCEAWDWKAVVLEDRCQREAEDEVVVWELPCQVSEE